MDMMMAIICIKFFLLVLQEILLINNDFLALEEKKNISTKMNIFG